MSNNPIRLLRKAIRLKYKSTIPNICKWGEDKVRIWVPCTIDASNTERRKLAYALNNSILASGIPFERGTIKDIANPQICYFIINYTDLDALIGWVRIN